VKHKVSVPLTTFKRDTSGKFIASREESSEETADRIVGLMSENSHITISELAKRLEITTRAIEKQIAGLKKKGQLKRICNGGRCLQITQKI
jgi:ATP-dependent DNA helicase RecG